MKLEEFVSIMEDCLKEIRKEGKKQSLQIRVMKYLKNEMEELHSIKRLVIRAYRDDKPKTMELLMKKFIEKYRAIVDTSNKAKKYIDLDISIRMDINESYDTYKEYKLMIK